MGSLFVSYRRGDSPDTVKLIHERLKQRLPRWEIFYDHQSIPLGEKFPDLLRTKVTSATAVLVIIGPKWLEILQERRSAPIDHVREEVRLALESGTSVVPILVGKSVMPTDVDLADFADLQPLLQRNGRRVRPDPDFDSDLAPIIAHLKQFDAGETIGTTLDDKYTLTAEIGHGGMGVVYTAQQKQPVKRTVAVKLIKPGMDSRDVLARFDAERQALAVMDHPNIARVLDAGMAASGRPFFVTEHVKGVLITQYCDDKKLTPQERLNLFIPVCNAVQHAHQKGIIHRDLKPSNVLVEVIDGKPVPKVIDFGLAKALGHKLTDKTLYTALDTRVGTLEYSAPEQAAGRSFDVDTRSDIYSLGVLLYELLTGSLPFTHEDLLKIGEEEMRRVIRDVEPAKPSKKLSSSGELPAIAANRHLEPNKLTRLVQGDLDWIVMKCLEKENARRYETANELGKELQRFLADEPVQAGPPSASYRLKKFLRRNKGPVIAAALVFLALIAGVIGTSIGLVQAEQAREAEAKQGELTAAALVKSEENRKLAEKRFDEKRGALDKMLQSFSDDRLKLLPGSQQIRQVFFEKGLEQYAQILRERQDDPAVQARIADSYRELGVLRGEVGVPAEALAALHKAVALRRQMTTAAPDDAAAATALGHALFQLGQFHFEQRQTKDAVAPVQESVDLFTRLVRLHPNGAAYKAGLGRGLTRLASLKPELDQEKTLGRARDLLQEAAHERPADADVLTDLARTLNNLAAALPAERQSAAEGLGLYDQARKSADKALGLNPAHSLAHSIRAWAVKNRASQLARVGRGSESVQNLEEALSDSKAFVRKNPAVVRGCQAQISLQEELARRYRTLSKLDEAVALWEELARIQEGLAQRYPENEGYQVDRIEALFGVCDIEWGRSRLPKAAGALDRIVAGADDTMRLYPHSPRVFGRLVRAYYFRGKLEVRQERTGEALRFSQDGLALFERHRRLHGGDSDPPYQAFLCTVQAADCAKKLKDLATAIKSAERGSAIATSFTTPAMQRERLDLLITLAECCDQAGQTDKAIGVWKHTRDEAARLVQQTSFDFSTRTKLKDSLQQLAKLHRRNRDLQAEIHTARELLKVWSYFDGKDYSKVRAETADVDEHSANRLRSLLEMPPRMLSYTADHKIHIVEALQPLEDQLRWIEEVQGAKYDVDIANSLRSFHKKATENKVSFVDLCSHSYGTGAIKDENKLGIRQALDEISRLTIEGARTPGAPLRRRLAEAYVTLAEEYCFHSPTHEAASSAVEVALTYLELSPYGDPRDPADRDTLARLRFVQGKLAKAFGKREQAYDGFLKSLCLSPGKLRTGRGADERRQNLGEVCVQLGRRSEAAYWFFQAADLGDHTAVAELGELYMEEPRVAPLLPPRLVNNLEAVRQTQSPTKDKQKLVDQIRAAWKTYRVESLVASPTLPAAERAHMLVDLEALEQAETILKAALKTMPNDEKLRAELATCYRRLAYSYNSKQLYAEEADACKRSLESGGARRNPELLADYLKALILSGRAKAVETEAVRIGPRVSKSQESAKIDRAWECVTLGIRSVAALLTGEDYLAFLAEAKGKAPEVCVSWDWDRTKEELGESASLTPEQKKKLDGVVRELNRIMVKPGAGQVPSIYERILADEYSLIFLQGKNTNGDLIYIYLQVPLVNVGQLKAALKSDKTFNASQYGVIKASGRGDPSPNVKRELAKRYPNFASKDPYLGPVSRGSQSFREHRYKDALTDLKTASESPQAVADDYTQLGQCYGKLGQWDEAIIAHKRAFVLEAKSATGTDAALNLLQTFIVSERPAEVAPFVGALQEKEWQPREEKTNRLNQASALLYGFQAIAQRMLGKDAAELEKKMRQHTALTRMQGMNWDWQQMDDWLKATKLAPDRKSTVEKILAELKGVRSQVGK